MKKILRNHRGISLAEAVIAMAVILIVSAAATTLIATFAKVSARMSARNEATLITENCLEAFKFVDNKADFDATLTSMGYDFENNGDGYALSGSGYHIMLQITFDVDHATYAANVIDSEGRGILTIPTYTRYYQ